MDKYDRASQHIKESLNTKNLAECLTQTGRFSYCALCATSLSCLYKYPAHVDFKLDCLRILCNHLKLMLQLPTMREMANCELPLDAKVYVRALKKEEVLKEGMMIIVQDLLLLAISNGTYDARWRVLILYVTRVFDLDLSIVDNFELNVVNCLSNFLPVQTEQEQADAARRLRVSKTKRFALIGLASVGGGILLGLSGGLAAPLIGTGLSSVLGTSIFGAIGSVGGTAIVGSLFGVAGASLTGYKMHKRVGDIEEFQFCKLSTDTETGDIHLHITIAISGWLNDDKETSYKKPWEYLRDSPEQYYLRYESSYLLEFGRAMEYFFSFAVSVAVQESLKYTVLSGLMAAIAWPAGILGLASVIDNPWGVCCRRSAQVGKQLAETLLTHSHGNRPVTLIGYSLGARVIYYCLREMSQRENCQGIVQDAILIGTPCTRNSSDWNKITEIVAGRVVNAYCRSDWFLKFLYRTLSMHANGVAGLQAIQSVNDRIENIDLTDIVSGHFEYPQKLTEILMYIGVNVDKSAKLELITTQSMPEKMCESLKINDDTDIKKSKSVIDLTIIDTKKK
ncbi:transmembrane and coiled-coil domain-containing protein 4-like isoform X2 [Melanaphis sacchari]|uniref:transmembrane and coiled-coil domain-containing protein 4-like isoform X2 n=1 Tax=Melanaphis sacchari TaxID=742174 RepID=UPI000DC13422|nr:transmembrane and coiled-coil domain-containing protein 4-like isoform X2 [Melanaphis sacchari]